MRRQTPELEWHVIENDEEWERRQALSVPTAVSNTGSRLHLQKYAGSVIALLLLLVMGGAWWRTFQANQEQRRSTVGATVPGAQYAGTSGPVGAVGGATQSSSDMQRLTQGITAGQSEQRLTTPYFIYHFRQPDSAVVHTVAPSMDAFYTILWHNLGLPIHPTRNKLVIDVTLDQLPGQAMLAFDSARAPSPENYLMPGDPPTEPGVIASVNVPSPARYVAPATLGDADLLAQSIALPLLSHGLAQAREQHQIGPAWQPLLDGLYLWQVWDLDLPLATWRETVVQWQYRDLPFTPPEQVIPLPPRYQELCAAHKRWMQSPVQIHIPLLCTGRKREDGYWHTWRFGTPLTHLAQLAVPSSLTWGEGASPVGGPPFFTNHPGQTVALATLIDYAVTTYGRARLPALVAGLGQYDRWETLVPAVYGVSATEFEAGWQAYLLAHYGVATKP